MNWMFIEGQSKTMERIGQNGNLTGPFVVFRMANVVCGTT
jgi:hypothetical protein